MNDIDHNEPLLNLQEELAQEIDSELVLESQDGSPFDRRERHEAYESILHKLLPHLEKDDQNIVSACVMLALKLDGIIGKDLSKSDTDMIIMIKDTILASEERKDNALMMARRLMDE